MTGDGAHRCVLCQQELDAEAANRLARFEAFVKDETKRKEELAAAAYRAALDELTGADVPAAKIPVAVALIRDELNDDELARTVRRVAVTMKWRLRMIRRDHTKADDAGPFPGAESWPTDDVAAHSASLSARITALRAKNESEERNVPHPVPWTHICAMPPGTAHTPRAPRSACDTQASQDARSGCTAPRSRPRRRGRPRGSERFGRGSLAP